MLRCAIIKIMKEGNKMLLDIIKKDIDKITLQDLYDLYNFSKVSVIKINDHTVEFIKEK